MAGRAVTYAIANHQVIGAMKGEPAVVALPKRRTDDGASTHGVSRLMEVQVVAAQLSFLSKMPELGVRDGAGGMHAVHYMSTFSVGIGGFDDHIPAQVRHLSAVRAVRDVVEVEPRIQQQDLFIYGRNRSLLRPRIIANAVSKPVSPLSSCRRRYDNAVTGSPTLDGFREPNCGCATHGRRAQLRPGTG